MLKSDDYQNILKIALLPYLDKLAYKNPLFLQDGATCHTSASTKKFLEENKINLISNYPPQSPDLNVIENVWSMIKRKIDLNKASTNEEIFDIVKKEWDSIPQCEIQKLIDSMERRIKSVISAKGGNTKY